MVIASKCVPYTLCHLSNSYPWILPTGILCFYPARLLSEPSLQYSDFCMVTFLRRQEKALSTVWCVLLGSRTCYVSPFSPLLLRVRSSSGLSLGHLPMRASRLKPVPALPSLLSLLNCRMSSFPLDHFFRVHMPYLFLNSPEYSAGPLLDSDRFCSLNSSLEN